MSALLGLLGTALFVELLFRLPVGVAVQQCTAYGHKSVRTLGSSHISDHWKEKVLLAYACRLLQASCALFVYLAIAGLPMMLLIAVAASAGIALTAWIGSGIGILSCTALGCGIAVLRRTFPDRHNHG